MLGTDKADDWGPLAGHGGMVQDFTMLLRMTRDLKTYELFISGIFHLIFQNMGTLRNWNCRKQNHGQGGTTVITRQV